MLILKKFVSNLSFRKRESFENEKGNLNYKIKNLLPRRGNSDNSRARVERRSNFAPPCTEKIRSTNFSDKSYSKSCSPSFFLKLYPRIVNRLKTRYHPLLSPPDSRIWDTIIK